MEGIASKRYRRYEAGRSSRIKVKNPQSLAILRPREGSFWYRKVAKRCLFANAVFGLASN
jgi:hypothetical protein